MKHAILLSGLVALFGACSSSRDPGDFSPLQFYDWLELRQGEYNAALNQRDGITEMKLAGIISVQAQRRYDMVITDAANQPDPDRRGLATFALGFSRRPEAIAHLEPRLADSDPVVRATAAAAIAFLGVPNPPIDKIGALLDDREWYVRHAALFSLSAIFKSGQETPFYKRIVEFLDDPRADLRSEAVRVLDTLRRKDSLTVLVKKGLVDPSGLVKINSAMALGNMGSDAIEAAPLLIERLRDADAGVVEAVYWALKKITNRDDADRSYHNWREWYDEQVKFFEYVCPKHPEIAREVGGACAQCGSRMELRTKINPAIEYYCPKDLDIAAPTPGKCAKCRSDLIPRKKVVK